LGLAPAGADYALPVPLERARVLPQTALQLTNRIGVLAFPYPAVLPDRGTGAALREFAGPLVYVGASEDVLAAGPGGPRLHGTVALSRGTLSGEAAEMVTSRGAVGLVQIVGDSAALARYRRALVEDRLYNADRGVESSILTALPSAVVGEAFLHAVLAGGGLPDSSTSLPAPRRQHVAYRPRVHREPVDAANVACLLPGTDPSAADTAIVFSAHYDHLGIGPPDASGDSVYNGFSDNAAGVAMLLAVARAFVPPNAPLRHTALFLFFTGEERGLLGSDHFVARPAWPLDQIRAVINLDAGAPPAAPTSWRLAGVDSAGVLGAVAVQVAAERGWSVSTSPAKANSDDYPFWRHGVPTVFIIPGSAPYDGLSADSSAALLQFWDRYHRPSDEWTEAFPWAGVARYAEFAYLLARAVDAAP
jgi:hypothetical protein